MPLTAPALTSERLDLEPLRIEHAPEMVPVLADPGLYDFIGGGPPNEQDLTARYERQTSRPGWLNWVLRLRETGEAVGTVQATQLDDRTVELAWVVSAGHQDKGYATEATRAVIAWLGEQGIRTIQAHIHPDHAASNAVAERLGFSPTDSVKNGELRWKLGVPCHN